MFYSILLALHVLAAAIWVVGMFFAYNALRPAASEVLEPSFRLQLWVATFKRFFPWVWLSILLLVVSGMGMIMHLVSQLPVYILIMAILALVMVCIFAHVYYSPYRALKYAVKNENWPEGGKSLAKIRIFVGINTLLGLLTIIVATAGRSFF